MNSKGNTKYLKFSNYKNEFRSEIQQNYRKSSLLFWPSVFSAPPRQIFDRKDTSSGRRRSCRIILAKSRQDLGLGCLASGGNPGLKEQ